MAEFCPKCWNEINDTNYPENKYVLSDDLEMCEGCGEFKRVIVTERKSPYFKRLNYLTAPHKMIYMIFKRKRRKNEMEK